MSEELKLCENCRHCYEQPDWDLGRMARCEVHDSDVMGTQEACSEWSSSIFCPNFKCGCVTGKEPCIKEDNPEDCEKCERNGQCPNCCQDGDCEFQDYVDARLEQENKELREHCSAAQKAFRDERITSNARREKITVLKAERDRLREALREIIGLQPEVCFTRGCCRKCNSMAESARRALEGAGK